MFMPHFYFEVIKVLEMETKIVVFSNEERSRDEVFPEGNHEGLLM